MNNGRASLLTAVGKPPPETRYGEARGAPPRPPIKAISLLMPVWSHRYVSQFLEFCLPTLLAPGNVPAIGSIIPCRFILLSTADDTAHISGNSSWQELQHFCKTEIQLIDDLICGDHGATITLAFARAIRQTGEAMLDTCFIFLASDYLFAAGSLRTVVARVREGASCVLVGNYQIVAEDAIPLLRSKIDSCSKALVLPPRDLVRWSLQHLHPATLANIVNAGAVHNDHANRLFWRVDDDTLIGKFYLAHMIAVRPEVQDFVVGASCDYSFVPEMCPSGNIVAVTDSDDYLVVEMQPRDHEARNFLPGPVEIRSLAESLSEWTTADHRRNVEHTFIYHAVEIPDMLPHFATQAEAFVACVRTLLPSEPQPHRGHHYWLNSIWADRACGPPGKQEWEFVTGEPVPRDTLSRALWHLRVSIFGSPPAVSRLHPRWPDFALARKLLKRLSAPGRLLLVTSHPLNYSRWLGDAGKDIVSLGYEQIAQLAANLQPSPTGGFDCCLVVLPDDKAERADEIIKHTAPFLNSGAKIMILITNDRAPGGAGEFGRTFVRRASRLAESAAGRVEAHYVPASRMRWAVYRSMERLFRRGLQSGRRSPFRAALVVFAAAPLALASLYCNLITRSVRTKPANEFCSSVLLVIQPSV